ncbi:MAG: DinB family protein [Acidobacteriaceae bacterium]|jgi:uncharacterized damage-inducible protein DinB|nr:DinB family protein [Acidobacteriaceae bacterium]
MTYYGAKEMAAAFRTVRANTIQIAEDIPAERYDFRPSPDSRSVAETLAHIAFAHRLQSHIQQSRINHLQQVNFPELIQATAKLEAIPRTKAERLALLTSEGDTFATYLEGLPESFLAEPVRMMPGTTPATKSRFEMLIGVKEHEMHHRGQLMLMQRLLGITPHLTRARQQRAQAAATAAAGR